MADFTSTNQQSFEREPAKRVFAAELREAKETMKDGRDEKSPTYVLLPTGERCNRIFICGTVTQRDKTGDQNVIYRARVSDPSGVFFVSAGQYQPEAMLQLARIDPNEMSMVAVVGKPNVYEGQDGKKLVSVRAESVQVIDNDTRVMWMLDTAKLTLDRLDELERDESDDAKLAREKYSFQPEHWRTMVHDLLSKMV